MPLVESLLTAIVRADGDALVMHVGEKPYVVASAGPIELSAHGLSVHAMAGLVSQLLPPDAQRALAEFGAVEHELASKPEAQGDRFTVVVARGGDDVWAEVRRHRRARVSAEATIASAAPVASEASGATNAPGAVTDPATTVDAPNTGAAGEPPADATPGAPIGPVAPAAPLAPSAPALVSEPVVETVVEIPLRREPEPVIAAAAAASATVIPMTRTLRIEVPPAASTRTHARSDIERLLAVASQRGATALYLTTHASPFIRVEADVRALEGEPPLSATAVESAVRELMPETRRDAASRDDSTEWELEIVDIGRVRCSTFRDHRGPGAIVQFISARPSTAEQLGLSSEIQTLVLDGEGMVLVASPRGHGRTTLVGALVDLINRQRPTYVITLERQIRLVHEHNTALISQREVHGTTEQVLAVARAALREHPDVLVIEDLPSADMFHLALDAAGAGVLVIATIAAASATGALIRVVESFPPDRRQVVQSLLAERLRGAVAQVLLRKTGGGRLAAREVLLTTPAVANVLSTGQLHELPRAIESGRAHGLVSLTDALVQFIRNGALDLREAYRKTDDRDALVAALKRERIDTSLVERLA